MQPHLGVCSRGLVDRFWGFIEDAHKRVATEFDAVRLSQYALPDADCATADQFGELDRRERR